MSISSLLEIPIVLKQRLQTSGELPSEDIGVYLTARTGKANCFVSANYKLIATLVAQTQEFECLTPKEFVNKYL